MVALVWSAWRRWPMTLSYVIVRSRPTAVTDPVYTKPPVVEAVIELRFSTSFDGNGLARTLQPLLGPDYAGELQPVDQIEVETSFAGGGFSTSTRKTTKTWFIRSNSSPSVIGCGAGVLSVHEIAPYRGWPVLRATLDRVAAKVPDELSCAPLSFVGVRYINRIVLPDDAPLDEYLQVLPKISGSMPAAVSTFQWSITTKPDEFDTEAAFNIASAPAAPDGCPVVVLDLTLHQRKLSEPTLQGQSLAPILDRLHQSHRRVFEESITQKTRDLFR